MTTIASIVHSDPEILGGTPVFVGTRMPVRTLLDYLAADDPLEEFLDHFPTVSREQAVAALAQGDKLTQAARHPLSRQSMKVREVIKRLEADGWYRIRSKSGHRQFKHPVKHGRVTVSGLANIDVPIKTLKSIWKQAQLPEVD